MRYLILIALTVAVGCGQTKSPVINNVNKILEDSLVNYSYMLTGSNGKLYPTNGTGFIIQYKEKYFLITNYHVLTGKYANNGKKIIDILDTNKAIFVVFRPVSQKTSFYPIKYELFDSNGVKNFALFHYNDSVLIDIAVMPINIPAEAINYNLKIENVDTSIKYNAGQNLMVWGFPNANFRNTWQPTKMIVKSANPLNENGIDDKFFLFFSDTTTRGMSGSPVYVKNESGEIKVISVDAMNTNYDVKNPDIKGASILMKHVVDLILNMYPHPSVIGQHFPSK